MADDNSSGLFYFLAGTAVGAVLGVLFAPKAGTETREHLADWVKERRDKGSDLLHKVKDESIAKKEALVNAAKAAKDAYRDTNSKQHQSDGVSA
jgi:gas vesicle protein